MNNKQKAFYSLLMGIAIVVGIAIGQLLNFDHKKELSFKPTQKDKIDNLLRYIREEYVDSVKTDSIIDNGINGIGKTSIRIRYIFPKTKSPKTMKNSTENSVA